MKLIITAIALNIVLSALNINCLAATKNRNDEQNRGGDKRQALINLDKNQLDLSKKRRIPRTGKPPRTEGGKVNSVIQKLKLSNGKNFILVRDENCKPPTNCPKDVYCPPNCGSPDDGKPIGSGSRV
jgi:hypothetical protein